MTDKKSFSLMPYLLVFLGTFLALQIFIPKEDVNVKNANMGDLYLETTKNEYVIGKDIKVSIYNNTDERLNIDAPRYVLDCEQSFIIYKYRSDGFIEKTNPDKECESEGFWLSIEPGQKQIVSLLNYTYTEFGESGRYKLALDVQGVKYESPEFEVKEPGLLTRLWRNMIYRPMLNALVSIISYMPGHHLGLAVIVLTLIIRSILLIPSQKGFEAQMRMQELQPELEKIKEKYKDDQTRLAQETMLLWKKHQVHPFSSCLPMLIQLPVFLALYYSIRGGLSPDRAIFIYPFLSDFDLSAVDPMFLGINLFERSLIALPLIVGSLQFIQMQIMMRKNKTSKNKMASEVESAQKMMRYMMPLMITFFTAQLPAAVGIYWATNTSYGIIQQLVVKKFRPNPAKSSGNEDVSVRVINKKHGKKH